jgi:ribose transport system substrate-binding protein
MKRSMLQILSVLLFVTVLAACGSKGTGSGAQESSGNAGQETASSSPAASTAAQETAGNAGEKLYVGLSIRSLTNPYYVQLMDGANMFIDTLPKGSAELQVLASDGSDEKQINDIKAFLAKAGKNAILYVDPNNAPNAAVVAELCEEAGVYWSTTWSMADGVTPKDYKYYAFHQTVDDVNSGYMIAKALIEKFKTPGKGKILAVQGMLANTASINRTKGLEQALKENPGVELLDIKPADWNPQMALTLTETWLSTYKDIDGIWVANDSMALAVKEALKAAGKPDILVAGIDGIPDAITAVKSGELVATISNNPWAQGGFAIAILHAAYTGKLDKSKMTDEQMMFKTAGMLVSSDTVDDYIAKYVDQKPKMDFTNIFSTIAGPLN